MSDVGYKKPPEHTRFKSGQSGNPRGRPPGPKKPKRANEILDEALAKKVSVKMSDGTVVKMPRLEAGAHKLAQDFASGDKAARKDILDYLKHRGDFEPKAQKGFTGVAVLRQPAASAEQWEKQHGGIRRPLDPLEGLPGIDRDAINAARARAVRPDVSPTEDED